MWKFHIVLYKNGNVVVSVNLNSYVQFCSTKTYINFIRECSKEYRTWSGLVKSLLYISIKFDSIILSMYGWSFSDGKIIICSQKVWITLF